MLCVQPRAITFIKVKRPNKELVTFLYKNFTFSEDSMLSDFSKLYCKSPNINKLRFDIVFALYGHRIVGWGISTENLARNRKSYDYKDILHSHNDSLVMLYVGKSYRKMGIASQLFRRLLKLSPNQHLITIGHDKASFRFFSKMKMFSPKKISIVDWR